MRIVMDYIINLLFTLLQIVANDKIISHIVIMIVIKADLMGKMHPKEDFIPDYKKRKRW